MGCGSSTKVGVMPQDLPSLPFDPAAFKLVLTKKGSPRQLIFDQVKALGQKGTPAYLTLASHPGMAVVPKAPATGPICVGNDNWMVVELGVGPADKALNVTFDNDGFLTSTHDAKVFDIAWWKYEDGNDVNLVGEQHKLAPTRDGNGGRTFVLNADGTISAAKATFLVLGVATPDTTPVAVVPTTAAPAAAPAAPNDARGRKLNRKLNVLCLHGTTMNGNSMRGLFQWKECAIEPTCKDIANFFYPTGPCIVSKNHEIFKQVPAAGPPGPDKRHWFTMGDKWDFSKFGDARKTITDFVDTEVAGPIDVVCGYSQGAAAATQLLNEIFDKKIKNKNLKHIKGAIFLGCPNFPKASPSVSNAVMSLHCNGNADPLTKLSDAKEHAAQFKKDTFFEYQGTHDIRKPCADPCRQFLLALKNGVATE